MRFAAREAKQIRPKVSKNTSFFWELKHIISCSNTFHLSKHSSISYGKPVPGSKTEARGIKAHEGIEDEIRVLCSVIEEHGTPIDKDVVEIKFGELFRLYSVISTKLVGVLIRARKHGFVEFEGEMLYQKRDDHVVIRLVKSPPRAIQVTKNQIFKLGQSLDSNKL